ncbi:FAD-dependent oxidoreductase [Dietzia sp.]
MPNLVLAGEWTRTDWPSTMEGAAQSAARALDVLDPELSRAAVEV